MSYEEELAAEIETLFTLVVPPHLHAEALLIDMYVAHHLASGSK